VATAAGLCYGSLGSDTGGSIRFPAAANGVTGLKPTWGRVSRYGVFELAATLDHIGPMARSAADCGAMLGAIAGSDPHDPTAVSGASAELPRRDAAWIARSCASVSITAGTPIASTRPAVDAVTAALATVRELGADIREVKFPNVDQDHHRLVPVVRCGGRRGARGDLPRAQERVSDRRYPD
jgi:amidase